VTFDNIKYIDKNKNIAKVKINDAIINCKVEYDENAKNMTYEKQRKTWQNFYEETNCLIIGKSE
jgi:hypothetical protein